MQDRYENAVISVSKEDYALTKDCTFGLTDGPDPCLEKWEAGTNQISKGIYATNGGAVAYVLKSSVADSDADVIILGAPGAFPGYFPGYSSYTLGDKRHWSWLMLKGHTRNRAGTVKLVSTDPRDMPNITFNNFAQGGEEDLQALYEGFQWSRRAFADYVPLFGAFEEDWPGTNYTEEATIKQWLHDETWGHHASCTCPMGADNDPMAVLDSKLKVRGVDGLRVVDASVFPRIPGFYIATAIYTMSQKASEVIIADAAAEAA
jgi:choline dehydrogenase